MDFDVHIYLKLKSVRIDVLDAHDRACFHATGFIVQRDGRAYLYTCWHVVTGIDPLVLQFTQPPNREKLRVHSQKVEQRAPGITAIGGQHEIEVDLYDVIGDKKRPRWYQGKAETISSDLNAIGLRVPKLDVVKIPIDLPQQLLDRMAFHEIDLAPLNQSLPLVTEKIVVAGFPYGYSALGDRQPTPVFITRFVASDDTPRWTRDFLIDGVCAKGMSGSPVLVERMGALKLIGVYIGAEFPDYVAGGRDANDRHAALGRCCNLAELFVNEAGWVSAYVN